MAAHCSIFAWKNPMDRGAWQATVHGVAKELDMTKQVKQQHFQKWEKRKENALSEMISSFMNEDQLLAELADHWEIAWNSWFGKEGAKFLNKHMKIIQLH